jgi:uncharacterized membrane protein
VRAPDSGAVEARLGEYRAQAVSRRQRQIRSNVAVAACALDLVTMGLIAGQAHGPFRQVIGLAFCLFVPGWAIIGRLRLHNAALEAGLAVAVSLESLLVVAQLAITFGAWSLTGVDVVVCIACVPSLLWQATEQRRFRAPT